SSIVADRRDKALGVVIPMDRYGNAPDDGTPVRLRRVLPTGQVLTATTGSKHLMAWGELPSGRVAGTSLVHAEQEDATGPSTRLAEVAGPPGWFRVVSQ